MTTSPQVTPRSGIELMSAPELIAHRAALSPDTIFLRDVAGGTLTYGQLHTDALRWADALERGGVQPDDAVGSMLPNGTDTYAVWLGAGWLHAMEVPINVELRGSVLRHVLTDARVEVLVVHADVLDRVMAVADELPALRLIVVIGAPGPLPEGPRLVGAETFLSDAGETPRVPPQGHDIASVLYTSGTTGPSKGVLVPWAQLQAGSVPTIRFATNDGADRFYATGSPSHVVSKGAFMTMALTEGELIVRPTFSLSEFWLDVRRFGIRSTVLVGAMADFLLAAEPAADDADTTLTNVLMAPVTPRVDEFNARFGTRAWTAYNMTEISVPFATEDWGIDDPASCGVLRTDFPHYEARLVDEWDNEVETGEVGELIVRTGVPWTLNAGYLHQPEATARAWRNGWFHTGDAFRRDAEGRYYFVDRMKDTIRRRGENISSFEVEAEVLQHPQVAECAAVAVSADELEDEIKVVVVESAPGALDPAELVSFLSSRVPRYMVPRYVEIVAELPRTQTLRVQKAELRARQPGGVLWDRQVSDR
ncbi:ATP-dependent acyl-CoA ligase [Aeromicrobium panaciterrae]|uniref:AMP-binding protein n=1 Tax=Aeromicrobium panaciterrae TaxID=363861 RepID=UPI0031D08941